MIDALKRRINRFRWYLNPLQSGTIQRELMKEFDEMLRVVSEDKNDFNNTENDG